MRRRRHSADFALRAVAVTVVSAPGSSGVTIQLGWLSVTVPSAASHSKLTLIVWLRYEPLRKSNWTRV